MRKTMFKKAILFVFLVFTIASLATFSFVEVALASPAYEAFTQYTETDPNSHITVTNSTHISADLNCSEDAYVYQQRGVDHFVGNFSHRLDVYVDNATGYTDPTSSVWALSDKVDNRKGLEDADENFLSTNVGETSYTFGYTTVGGTTKQFYSDDLVGCIFTSPSEATIIPRYIHFYASVGGGVKIKMAIYKNSDLSLVCQTEELTTESGATWRHARVTSYVTLETSTDYILCVWANGVYYIYYNAGTTAQTVEDVGLTYNGFPATFGKDATYDYKTSIYCSYAVTPTIELEESYGGSTYTDYCNASFDTWYYLLVKRASTTFTCGIYSTSALRNAGGVADVDTLTITLQSVVCYDYVFACLTYNDGTATDSVSVQVRNYDFRYTYEYTFLGLYNEVTGLRDGAVNVTAQFLEGYYPETFEVNGTYVYQHSQKPVYFRFNLTNYREYWLGSDEDTATIYIFDDSTTAYTIAFYDLAGVLSTYPFVEAKRYVNATLRIVEKQKVDVEKKAVIKLINGDLYTLVVTDGRTYTFGDLRVTDDTTIQLTLKGLEFPKETLMTYKNVRIYGTRAWDPSGTGNITITYQDVLNKTTSVKIDINYRNGTNAYTDTETSDSFNHIWASALNNTDYAVVCTITHEKYGSWEWKQYFPRTFSTAPFGLDFLGTLPFVTSTIIPAMLILFVAGAFSEINAEVGAFMGVVTALILTYMGWINIGAGYLVTAFCLAILMALVYSKRRVQMF